MSCEKGLVLTVHVGVCEPEPVSLRVREARWAAAVRAEVFSLTFAAGAAAWLCADGLYLLGVIFAALAVRPLTAWARLLKNGPGDEAKETT